MAADQLTHHFSDAEIEVFVMWTQSVHDHALDTGQRHWLVAESLFRDVGRVDPSEQSDEYGGLLALTDDLIHVLDDGTSWAEIEHRMLFFLRFNLDREDNSYSFDRPWWRVVTKRALQAELARRHVKTLPTLTRESRRVGTSRVHRRFRMVRRGTSRAPSSRRPTVRCTANSPPGPRKPDDPEPSNDHVVLRGGAA